VDVGFDLFDYTLTGKSQSQLKHDLASTDILYVSGGSTFYLLQQSNASGFTTLVNDMVVNQGKIYIGTSAGSIIAGPVLPAYLLDVSGEPITTELIDGAAYGLVNFTILPHWGSPHFKQRYLESRIETIYSPHQPPTILLTDYQYIRVTGDVIQIVDANPILAQKLSK
jgi:dipeptidase E